MTGVLRVLIKDAAELVASPRLLVLSFVVAPSLLLLVGQLNIRPPQLSVLMSGLANCESLSAGVHQVDEPKGEGVANMTVTVAEAPMAVPAEETIFRYLRELSHVAVSCRPAVELDPFRSLAAQPVDMLVNVVDAEDERWGLYVKETNPRRLSSLLELARGIQMARKSVTGADAQTLALYRMSLLGAMPLQAAVMYYPQTADKSLALLPMTFSLILCFLAFIVAAPSLIRERELHTLEILLGAPGIRGNTVLVGKVLLPILVSLFAALIMLVSIQAVYGLYAKANVALFIAFLILPILSSTLFGLLVSALARSQVQTVMAAAIYFFCLLLLSGFLYPAEASTAGVRTVTKLFGLTYLLDPANAWFFGADPFGSLDIMPLVLQCLSYAALAGMAWRHQLRRI